MLADERRGGPMLYELIEVSEVWKLHLGFVKQNF